ncbi:MAG TPA: Gfo/Idh/MocA family oxidoreductase [Candidatus Acidoferrales bacterium]|nr:Gfo/Idh/MocA family oxidoreductase [Candidatus Acidoferrales bacterium]
MNRRTILQSAPLLLSPATVFGSQANSTIELGLIGCGGRGNWIAPLFTEYAPTRWVALADVVRAKLDSTRDKLKVAAGRAYYGPDAYRELAHSAVDAVVIETPTYYHPAHAAAAVEAGKHVYSAKPIAADVPSSKDFLAAGQRAEAKGRSFWVDFQSRARPVFQELVQRIRRGDIGKPALAQVFYYAGRPWKDPAPDIDPALRRMLAWFGDRALSGDIIVEQNIHVIDMANWYLGSHPLKATGSGGRTDWSGTQNVTGDAYDHFSVTYWYPNDVHASFSSHQLNGAFSDLCVRCIGVRGTADTHYGGLVRIAGENAWKGTDQDDTFRGGCVANIQMFIDSIRNAKPINNAATAVESNLTAILGRTAAYEQRLITWDEMLASTDRWQVNLPLKW